MARKLDRQRETQRQQQRTVLAQEAARLIREHGIKDFRTAKSKAAWTLGLTDHGALPSNLEIEAALAERNRIFGPDRHADLLHRLRSVALDVMHELQPFRPRLVGPVLSGNVTEHSSVEVHVFSDEPEAVALRLETRGIHCQPGERRHRVRRDRVEEFPGYDFWTDGVRVETCVFPERGSGNAPLSPVDGKPMRRARPRDVESLLAAAPAFQPG